MNELKSSIDNQSEDKKQQYYEEIRYVSIIQPQQQSEEILQGLNHVSLTENVIDPIELLSKSKSVK
jgi:hypothetical protein